MSIVNSTISGNQATSQADTAAATAGGIVDYTFDDRGNASITLNQVTFSGNTAALATNAKDLYLNQTGTGNALVSLAKTTLGSTGAGNPNVATTGGASRSCWRGGNVVFDGSASTSLTGTHDLNNTNALLGPLQNNGGTTLTQALAQRQPGTRQRRPQLRLGDHRPARRPAHESSR